jgi:flagellar biogenesis protein FliO
MVCLCCAMAMISWTYADENSAPQLDTKAELVALAAETPATIPAEAPAADGDESAPIFEDYWYHFSKMIIVLAIVVAALLISARFLRHMMKQRVESANKFNAIKVLERRVLAQKAVVYLLEVPGKRLVIGESAAGLHPLAEMPIDVEIPQGEEDPLSFQTIFNRAPKK